MLIEDEWKRTYLNEKPKEIIPFPKKFTPKEKKEATVILKNFLNKDRGYSQASMLAVLASSRTRYQYKKLIPGYTQSLSTFFQNYCSPRWSQIC